MRAFRRHSKYEIYVNAIYLPSSTGATGCVLRYKNFQMRKIKINKSMAETTNITKTMINEAMSNLSVIPQQFSVNGSFLPIPNQKTQTLTFTYGPGRVGNHAITAFFAFIIFHNVAAAIQAVNAERCFLRLNVPLFTAPALVEHAG